jgi:hypothetical protein
MLFNNVESNGVIQTIDGMIFTTRGYYFGNLPRTNPPYKVNHIVEHIIE